MLADRDTDSKLRRTAQRNSKLAPNTADRLAMLRETKRFRKKNGFSCSLLLKVREVATGRCSLQAAIAKNDFSAWTASSVGSGALITLPALVSRHDPDTRCRTHANGPFLVTQSAQCDAFDMALDRVPVDTALASSLPSLGLEYGRGAVKEAWSRSWSHPSAFFCRRLSASNRLGVV